MGANQSDTRKKDRRRQRVVVHDSDLEDDDVVGVFANGDGSVVACASSSSVADRDESSTRDDDRALTILGSRMPSSAHTILSPPSSTMLTDDNIEEIVSIYMGPRLVTTTGTITQVANEALSTTSASATVTSAAMALSSVQLEQMVIESDNYYDECERRLYEMPRPTASVADPAPFTWQRGELLGSGAFGSVYLALNTDEGKWFAAKQVALSVDDADRGDDTNQFVQALVQEIAVLKTLQHENIVQYYGTERTADTLNIFLEYVPGGSIASIIKRFGKFNENLVRVYTRQILYGLEYLHRHQIMHRDIKGANILVDTNGVCKLADFGAAARLADITQAQRRAIHGTPYWMAPEVIKQVGHGRQADIWSVGCTVIEMVTGKPPWHQFKTPVAALFHIAGTTSPPALPDDLSPSLRDFILSCMHRDPSKRPNAMRLLEHPYLKNGADPPSAATPSSPASAEGDAVADQARISDYLSARRASHLDSMRRSLVTRQGADDAPGHGDLSHDVAGDLAADSFSRSQSRRHSE